MCAARSETRVVWGIKDDLVTFDLNVQLMFDDIRIQ